MFIFKWIMINLDINIIHAWSCIVVVVLMGSSHSQTRTYGMTWPIHRDRVISICPMGSNFALEGTGRSRAVDHPWRTTRRHVTAHNCRPRRVRVCSCVWLGTRAGGTGEWLGVTPGRPARPVPNRTAWGGRAGSADFFGYCFSTSLAPGGETRPPKSHANQPGGSPDSGIWWLPPQSTSRQSTWPMGRARPAWLKR
jgi:hypothetical protein